MPKLSNKSKRLRVYGDDLAQLRASGLTDDTIRENGLWTASPSDGERVAEILNCGPAAQPCSGGLIFPYRGLDGEVNCFARVRPHVPRMSKGKPIKYEQPKGSALRAYYPAASVAHIGDGQSPIFVTEGEKKALALSQLGVAAIGIGGVYCWKVKGLDQLIDDLAAIKWQGRDVYVVFDYDEKAKTRRQVQDARRRLAKALRTAGAKEVYDVELPPGPNDAKQGVDDFLVAHGAEAFHALVQQAEPVPSADYEPMTKASGRTDTANAARIVGRFGEDIRWVGAWDKWLIWDGQRWRIDQSLQIESRAKEIAADLWKEIGAAASGGGIDHDTLRAMYSFAKTSSSANGIRNMVALARSEPGVPIGLEALDSDPLLLNVQNGTIDLRTGKLREHRRDDFLTKLAPVAFDSAATCPRWKEFLRRIFDGNKDLIGYMQRLVGYCLTGQTEEHILPFLYGMGANGKSTLVETGLKVLGSDYSMKAPPDLLMAKRGESHPTERADLFGKRLVACIETEDGRRMAEALVKELTGGDRVRARRMREDFWEFTPTHHVWLAGNYKPTITGTDYGIWRRIKLIPFNVVIPDAEQDKKLPAKLADELSGILNWALEGCLEWQRSGMQEPEVVRAATKEYSDEMDEVGQFIEQYCELGQDFMAPATELYEEFGKQTGSKISQRRFGQALARRGFESGRITSGVHKAKHGWKGLRLRSDAGREEAHKQLKKTLGKQRRSK